jgi:nuclease A inhibitor-like protein
LTITEYIKGLNYRSESDSEWTALSIPVKGSLSCSSLKRALRKPPLVTCLLEDTQTFIDHTVTTQPQTDEYESLFNFMLEEYTDLKVFKFASMQEGFNQEVYVIGTKDEAISGIMTYAVET